MARGGRKMTRAQETERIAELASKATGESKLALLALAEFRRRHPRTIARWGDRTRDRIRTWWGEWRYVAGEGHAFVATSKITGEELAAHMPRTSWRDFYALVSARADAIAVEWWCNTGSVETERKESK